MRKLIRDFLSPETLRYLVFGLLTVAVNMAAYRLLEPLWGTLWANTAAFFIAVLFAYFTNSLFVFRAPLSWKSFAEFFGMRIGTIVIDDGGMLALTGLGWNGTVSKLIVNVVIIGINYLFSKLLIFRKKEE